MKLHTIWLQYEGEDWPALSDAWDQYAVDSNRDGWNEVVNKARASLAASGSGVVDMRIVMIHVSDRQIMGAFVEPVFVAQVDSAATHG